jgi:hypothetical protein
MFVESDTPATEVESKQLSLCTFSLDLGSENDREVAKDLIGRVVSEDTETWEAASLNGLPFQFDADEHTHEWVDEHTGTTLIRKSFLFQLS